MLIESASTRLAIDLLESLRKHKLIVSDIRVSYITKEGNTSFQTFQDINALKSFYQSQFGRIVAARRNPFTKDRRKAQLTPTVDNGIILAQDSVPLNDYSVSGICKLGRFMSVERFRLTSSSFNFDVIYNCYDVSDILKIVEGKKQDLRRNTKRQEGVTRHRKAIQRFISDYKTILTRLYRAFNANLYVDLCYVAIGYVEESILLYSIFFALVKERIDSGLRLSVLEPRYLKKIN